MVIGVVGVGFVGQAVANYMRRLFRVETYDIDPEKSTCKTLYELVDVADTIFVSVPTPMNKDGSCNTGILESVIEQINTSAWFKNTKMDVIIKSTVPPGTTDKLQRFNINVIFNPEFLTEANAQKDFDEQDRIILGGERLWRAATLYSAAFPQAEIVECTAAEAEMLKYVSNCFLALKVSFSNEIWELCQCLNISHENVVKIAAKDDRLGKTHWKVPGPDGHYGFGGTCFPKDMNALIRIMENNNIYPHVLKAAWHNNLEVRPERDWEQLKGRAVSE
jgi:nucleotide sugar dehydrogenase